MNKQNFKAVDYLDGHERRRWKRRSGGRTGREVMAVVLSILIVFFGVLGVFSAGFLFGISL